MHALVHGWTLKPLLFSIVPGSQCAIPCLVVLHLDPLANTLLGCELPRRSSYFEDRHRGKECLANFRMVPCLLVLAPWRTSPLGGHHLFNPPPWTHQRGFESAWRTELLAHSRLLIPFVTGLEFWRRGNARAASPGLPHSRGSALSVSDAHWFRPPMGSSGEREQLPTSMASR
ncbi:hypothetical protein QQ045_010502 [Rhodiola kirilowii]